MQEIEDKEDLSNLLEKKRIRADGSDCFIRGFSELIRISDERRRYGSPRERIRLSLSMFNLFGFDIMEKCISEGLPRSEAEEIMSAALYDSASSYIGTMDSDRYGKKLLGLVDVRPEEKLRRSAADVWSVMNGAAFLWKNTGIEKFENALPVFEGAIKTAYSDHDEEALERLRHEILTHR